MQFSRTVLAIAAIGVVGALVACLVASAGAGPQVLPPGMTFGADPIPYNAQFAAINESTAASNEIVAAVTSQYVRVLGMFVMSDAIATVTVEDEDGNDLIGPLELAASGGFVLVPNEIGYTRTPAGKALHLLSDTTAQLGGVVIYTVDD